MVPQMYTKEFFASCDCGTEVLRVSIDQYEDENIDVMFSILALDPRNGWKNRLRYAWKILTSGLPFGDQVIISSGRAETLCKDILLNLEDIKNNG